MKIIRNANTAREKIEQIGVTEKEAREVYRILSSFEIKELDLSNFRPEVAEGLIYVLGMLTSFKKEVEVYDKMDFTEDKKMALSYCMIVMLLSAIAYTLNLVNENDFKKSVGLFYYLADEAPNLKTSELLK